MPSTCMTTYDIFIASAFNCIGIVVSNFKHKGR